MASSGFAMKFCPRREAQGEYCPLETVFVDGLQGIAEQISQKGTRIPGDNSLFNSRENYYSLEGESLVTIEESTPRSDTRMDVSSVDFFNPFSEQDLKGIIERYGLPFHKEQVRRT